MSLEIDGMERWQTDDATAFEALFRQYEGLVFRNAYFITGSRLEAEEITQDVFVSFFLFFSIMSGKLVGLSIQIKAR
jgi:DNA-directed RNA polymerase specialized sigma24 family protein